MRFGASSFLRCEMLATAYERTLMEPHLFMKSSFGYYKRIDWKPPIDYGRRHY